MSFAIFLSQASYASIGSGIAKGIVYLLIAVVLGMALLAIRPKPKREKPRIFLTGGKRGRTRVKR